MPEPRPLLDRFHRALADEIRASRPDYLRSSFTVAEIYQNLVPYRTHRDIIGVEMNGDYEDALLRLLVGEGDYLVLESEPARRRIEAELRSSNPNTTIYREFAAAGVRLNPALIPGDDGTSPAPRGPAGRVEVGLGAPPPPPPPSSSGADAGVNRELGLFVADLFGEAGREGGGPTGPEDRPSPVAPSTPVPPSAPVVPAAVDTPASPSGAAVPAPAVVPPAGTGGEDPLRASLQEENARLRRIVADQALEIQRLRERLEGR